MSEVNTNTPFDKLKRFTPNDTSLDMAEVLFRAGQASASRRNGVWKLTVLALLLAITALVGERIVNRNNVTTQLQNVSPVNNTNPIVIPNSTIETESVQLRPDNDSKWRLGSLIHTTDPDDLPTIQASTGLLPGRPPLTPSARDIN